MALQFGGSNQNGGIAPNAYAAPAFQASPSCVLVQQGIELVGAT
jgi:hypothetical protein